MAKIKIFNYMIEFATIDELKYERLFISVKFQMIKSLILDAVEAARIAEGLPNDHIGFLLTLEAEIKNTDHSDKTEQEIMTWYSHIITRIQAREALHARWFKNMGLNKLSKILFQLQTRIATEHFNQQFKQWIEDLYLSLKNQLEIESIAKLVMQAMKLYKSTAIRPIGGIRIEQQKTLLEQLQTAQTPKAAIDILYQHTLQIEQHHIAKSFGPCCPYYQTKSRLASHLNQAADIICRNRKHQTSYVEACIEHAITQYLQDDIFYHNRKRLVKAKQLLMQLRADISAHTPDQNLQQKYKLRTTLDAYISQIDADFNNTFFFSKYRKKRSRLACGLEVMKSHLIASNALSALELEQDVKKPIIQKISDILNTQSIIDIELIREMNTLINAIKEAQTPHAIESILSGHIRSYMQSQGVRVQIAEDLNRALVSWHASNLLPSCSEYKSFLTQLASERQTIENDLRSLCKRLKG
ncbi:MAG: hypothetical protein ABSF18_04420 [Gammaproteobacteria bacterium]|jgi:hypothetical protein